MTSQPYEQFDAVTHWRKDALSDNVGYGVSSWLKWAFLQVGGFENVQYSQASGLYGGHPAILRPVSDPNFNDGQVWESMSSDWVWETGIPYDTQPIQYSGVYIDGHFKEPDDVVSNHYVDYPRGRIVFDSAINTSSDVRCSYSFRMPTVAPAKESWMQELLYGSLDVYRSDFNVFGSGSHNQLSESRRQMPTIGVEVSDRQRSTPYQLGGGQYVYQDVIFYILTEREEYRDRIFNILNNQNDKVIYLPHVSAMKDSGNFPPDIDVTGQKVDNILQYPEIVGEDGFRWSRVKFINTHGQKMRTINDWLYRAEVRTTCEIIIENI